MADVGDFTPTETTDTSAEPDRFRFCGDEFEVPGTVGTGSLLRFTWRIKAASEQDRRGRAAAKKALTAEGKAQARQTMANAELDGSAAIYDLLLSVLGENQIDRFNELVDRHGVTVDGLLGVCNQIQEAITDRPTRQSADSSVGLSTNSTDSTGPGSGPTDPTLTPNQRQKALIAAMTGPADEVAGSFV